MMGDLWWCEIHEIIQTGNEGFCFIGLRTEVGCQMVRLRPSRDADGRLLGLLVEEECERCKGTGNRIWRNGESFTGDIPYCEPCGGSGRLLRAPVVPAGRLELVRDPFERLPGEWAVLPVGKETT